MFSEEIAARERNDGSEKEYTLVLARKRLALMLDQERGWHAKNETENGRGAAAADEEDDAEEEEEGEERERKSFTYETLPLERVETRRNGVPLRSAWIPASAPRLTKGMGSLSFLLHSFTSFSIRLSFRSPILCFPRGRVGSISPRERGGVDESPI